MNQFTWLLLAVVVLAAVLRIYALGEQSLWLDEAYQVRASGGNLTSILHNAVYTDTHPPLYYFLQHFWMLLFGQSEAAVRSLSACLGVLSVLLMYFAGRALFDRKTGLTSSLLLATSVFAISMSQEARPYSLLMLLTVLSFFFFIKILRTDEPSGQLLIGYTIFNFLALYTHIFAILGVGSQVLYVLLYRRTYPKVKYKLLLSYLVTLIGFSPWIYVLVTSTFSTGIHGLDWIPKPSLSFVLLVLKEMGGFNILIALLFLCLFIAGILEFKVTHKVLGKTMKATRSIDIRVIVTEPKTALLLIWFFVPLISSLVISFTMRPIFWDRYLIGIIPSLCLLVGRGISSVSSFFSMYEVSATTRPKDVKRSNLVATIIIIALILVLDIPSLHTYYFKPHKEQWREVASLIDHEQKTGDALVIYPDVYSTPFDYYYKGDLATLLPSQEVIGNESAVAGKDRLWLILMDYSSTRDAPIKTELFARFGNESLIYQKDFVAIKVYLFDTQKP